MVPASPSLYLPVFAGQGNAAINSLQTRQQALRDAASSSGSFLLLACHDAFLAELSTLPESDLSIVGVDKADFQTKESLLALPEKASYLHNPAISGPTLFLIQLLRYLAFVESTTLSTNTLTPFSDVLKCNLEHNLGILGFSSGILPACVVGTSFSTLPFISRAVEAYRLAIWVGVRTQIYRREALQATPLDGDTTLPWSLVFLGMTKADAEESIKNFNKDLEGPSLYITAVMDDTCITVSGRPDVLATFSSRFSKEIVIHKTTLDTLYHSPIHAQGVRDHVLSDVTSRNIQFPNFTDIKVPIRSTFTGDAITKETATSSLLEHVVDMLLTQPVNWDVVVEKVVKSSPENIPIQLLNIGPGTGLTRSIERAFPRGHATSLDVTDGGVKGPEDKVKQEPIAIVGMAVNMPGAPNSSKLWEILEQGINTVAEVPEHRFKVSEYNEGKHPLRTMKAHTGNFIDGVDEFDNKFFKISPREAKSMDPQQRILLHTAYEALEDSGYVPNATPTSQPESFGCYIGVATHDYLQNLRDDIDVYYSTGTLKAFLSGRLSYAMQLSGPSIVVDTACSSSNVALYQGARALMNRDCDAAMVGGVNVISSPDMFLGLDRGHFLSPTGQCKAFDASADGYSRSEGCGIFVLKRLSDALAENDRILGVIRGIEVNQSGLAHSITHPHAPTQATLFKRVLKNSGIDAARVNLVEAHGTGTQAGDPNELESIRGVFAVERSPSNPLHITSIKANIGHLEAASGAAGLAKILLMLQHKTIPKQILLQNLNPRIAPLESDHAVINRTSTTWLPSHEGKTRVALLNNFGAAGSNTALLIEEHPNALPAPKPEAMHYVFGMSAKDRAPLEELRAKYIDYLQSRQNAAIDLPDIAYTSTARRQVYEYRLSASARTKDELLEKLRNATIAQVSNKTAHVVFVFSGQGSQYLGMGHSLYLTNLLFRRHVDECHAILTSAGFPGVHAILTAGSDGSGLTSLEEFEAYQAAIFALEYSLAKLWMSWGVEPSAVVGHSLGEYAALVIAGVVSLKGALMLVANRVRLMMQKCAVETTGMIAVNTAAEAVADILGTSSSFPDLSIACYNSSTDCVISGPLSQIASFKEHLDREVHCKNVRLSVPFGYHSPAMTPLLEDLTAVASHVTLRAPMIPIVSNVLGETVLPGDTTVFNPEYFSRHCSEPVQFEKGIRSLVSTPGFSSVDAWIEIGPHTSTLPMLKVNSALDKGALLLASIRKQQEPWSTLTTSLAQLYTSSIKLRWREVYAHLDALTCVSLPSYPFVKSKFWVAFKESQATAPEIVQTNISPITSLISDYSMLYAWKQRPSEENGFVAIFETPISELAGSIRGHSVGGMPLCPASVYLEQVLAGIKLSHHHMGTKMDGNNAILRRLEFAKPLVYDEAVERIVYTTIAIQDGCGTFNVSSRATSSSEEPIHVHGQYQMQSTIQTSAKFTRVLPVITRRMASVAGPTSEIFSTRTAYEVIFPRVVDYAKEYHTMKSIAVDASGMEGCAEIRLPSDHHRGKYVAHPVFVDTLLHVAGFVANMQGGVNDAYICSQVGSVKVISDFVNTDSSYKIYCSNAWVPEDEMVLAEAYAVEIEEPRRIVAVLKDMAFRRVRLDRLKRGLAHAAGKSITHAPPRPTISVSPSVTTKVSRPSSRKSFGNVRDLVLKIVSETCSIADNSIDVKTDLASLGVDSLMSIEIFGKLEDAFPGTRLDAQALSHCNCVSDIIQEISTGSTDSHSDDGDSQTTGSGISSPRTLVTDDKLAEPTILALDDDLNLKVILASVLDISIKDISDDVDFDSLGLDSLTSIEALHALKNQFGLDLSSNFFTQYPSARTAQAYLSSHLKKGRKTDVPTKDSGIKAPAMSLVKTLRLDTSPTCIQESNSGRTPLFLIHDGSGLINYYDRLSKLDRPIWGIHNPRFTTGQEWGGITCMAVAYANLISSKIAGPVILGGWSFGGVAAYETALQLTKKGIRVQGLLLIDSPNPINHVPLSEALIDSVVNLDERSATSELGRLVKSQFSMNARMLGVYKPQAHEAFPPVALLRSKEGYSPLGVTDVPSWLADRSNVKLATAGWESLAGRPLEVIDIPGHHFQPFHPTNIGEVSRCIAHACSRLEAS